MKSSDAPPTSRRALRAQRQEPAHADPKPAEAAALPYAPEPSTASGRVALAWVDPDALGARKPPSDLDGASASYIPVLPDLVPRRRRALPVVLVLVVLLALAGSYTAATQLWTLDNVAPAVAAGEAPTVSAPASEMSWPAEGAGAVGVEGVTEAAASTTDVDAMASITKLIAVLMVQDQDPIAEGESGPERDIVYADRADYWGFLGRGESALDVPLGGTLSRYQLMQGALIASAGNYVDMLVREWWETDEEFAAAARTWLDEHDLEGITVVEPTGIDRGNTADPASLVTLGKLALADPVIAEIVSTSTAEIPGVGEIDNTNPLLGDDGVVGVKTGGLFGHYNLLAARDVTVDDTTVRVYAAVVGQPTETLRADETAALLDQIAEEASVRQTVPAGTVVGSVETAWGTRSDAVTTADASVLLWNGGRATGEADLALGDARAAEESVGSLTVTGPLDEATVDVALTTDLGEPDGWWRFTHPLQLFGLAPAA